MSAESLEMVIADSVENGFILIDGKTGEVPFKNASISKGPGGHATVSFEIPTEGCKRDDVNNINWWITSAKKTDKLSVLDKDKKLVCELFDASSCTMNPQGKTIHLIVSSHIQ